MPNSVHNKNAQAPNAYQRLKAQRLQQATRPFLARGKDVNRCSQCMLWQNACICPWCKPQTTNIDLALLYHRDEIFKPTNTGRLIADVLPNSTHAFLWDRTEPSEDLQLFLQDPTRRCLLVFPADDERQSWSAHELVQQQQDGDRRKLTLILLDATWRQGRKMSKASWLKDVDCFALGMEHQGQMSVRNAAHKGMLSTAEAAAQCLDQLQQGKSAKVLQSYFNVFHQHYQSTRSRVEPDTESTDHKFLSGLILS